MAIIPKEDRDGAPFDSILREGRELFPFYPRFGTIEISILKGEEGIFDRFV